MAFGGGLEAREDVVSEINMTPLVDVMLVLLIIFMLTVPVLTHSVKLDLPRAQAEPNVVKPETVILAITADGGVYWNEAKVSPVDLERRLRGEASKQPQPEIQIRGDRNSRYEHVVKALSAVQRAGLLKVGVVTEPHE